MGPKALLELEGKTLLHWVTSVARKYSDSVLVSYPPGYRKKFAAICPQCQLVAGGDTRQASIQNLLHAGSSDWLVIADVVRPFVSEHMIDSVLEAAREQGIAGLFLRPDVPVAIIDEGVASRHLRKEEVGLIQSPQAFRRDILLNIYARAEKERLQEQSTIQLALAAGYRVRAVAGSKHNLKLTSAEDWEMAQALAKRLLAAT